MKTDARIKAALAVFALGGVAAGTGLPGGVASLVLVFAAFVLVPGYLALNLLDPTKDLLSIYSKSFAVGASICMLVGLALFFAKAPIETLPVVIVPIVAALFVANIRLKKNSDSPIEMERGPLTVWIAVGVFVVVAALLGSFRGWGEEWDYYTYITMVRRLAVRGFADNFNLSYSIENIDPIHSYNAWALMWAYLSRVTGLDPIQLYIRAAVLTIPASLLAFYSMSKVIANRYATTATLLWAAYQLIGMGMMLVGRSAFDNDDPACLIFFPMFFSFAAVFVAEGGRGRIALALLTLCGTFIVHPLWGALSLIGASMLFVANVAVGGSTGAKSKIAAVVGGALAVAPVLVSIVLYAAHKTAAFDGLGLWSGILLMLLPSVALMMPFVISKMRNILTNAASRRATIAFALSVATAVPFMLARLAGTGGARPEVGFESSPYKFFITGRLFILDPGLYTFTAPDMTFFPLFVVGLLALPFLLKKYAQGDRNCGALALGMLVIPFVTLHPACAYLFAKVTHVAYLRRALRLSAIFGAIGAGVAFDLVASKFGNRKTLATAVGLAIFSIAFYLWPQSPDYFRRALSKSIFVMTSAPSSGLCWSPDKDNHLKPGAVWDAEDFRELIERIPERETVFSDRFTSYRLTAWRDLFVVCRLKPSTGATDQARREADQAAFFNPAADAKIMCAVLSKYDARWVLVNADPEYRVHDYYLGDPWIVEKMSSAAGYFEPVGSNGPWRLFRATESCVGGANIRQ